MSRKNPCARTGEVKKKKRACQCGFVEVIIEKNP